MFLGSLYIESHVTEASCGALAPLLRHVLWLTYWVVQGSVMTGLWVIGHECGHGGFAKSPTVNAVTGWIVHSALLVPFFSWKISHARHHSNTGSLEHDEVFVPLRNDKPYDSMTAEERVALEKEINHESDSVILAVLDSFKRLFQMFVMFTVGWPLYLFINATGNKSYPKNAWVNHFMPSSPIFQAKEANLILLSDLGVGLALMVLGYIARQTSFAWVMYCYGFPYLVTNFWLVFITFNQHTAHELPHYNANEWDWLRGALATVDRDYGHLNGVFHHITDTHVAHHIFHTMPFYHAKEATAHIKMLIGDYYLFDRTPIFKANWNNFTLHSVHPDNDKNPNVYWFSPADRKAKTN